MIGKAPARQFHEFRHQVDAVWSDGKSCFPRPNDQRFQQQAICAANVDKITAPVNRLNEQSAGLLPPLSPTAAARLLVRSVCSRRRGNGWKFFYGCTQRTDDGGRRVKAVRARRLGTGSASPWNMSDERRLECPRCGSISIQAVTLRPWEECCLCLDCEHTWDPRQPHARIKRDRRDR